VAEEVVPVLVVEQAVVVADLEAILLLVEALVPNPQ
jgi:hypothetical protein